MPEDDISTDANGNRYDRYPSARLKKAQKIANVSWPFKDSGGFHARGINDQPAHNQRQVLVRLELERDGEVWLPGRASRWNASHVFVLVDDGRVPNQMVWVRAGDVKRA